MTTRTTRFDGQGQARRQVLQDGLGEAKGLRKTSVDRASIDRIVKD